MVRHLKSLGLYGLTLGLLLAALQAAQYKLLLMERALDWYIGLVAALFLVVGAWAGRKWIGRHVQDDQAAAVSAAPLPDAEVDRILEKHRITRREYEVLRLIAEGLSNQEIAARMFVSLNTVKTHTSNLFAKLDAQRRTQAVEKARSLGLIQPEYVHPKV